MVTNLYNALQVTCSKILEKLSSKKTSARIYPGRLKEISNNKYKGEEIMKKIIFLGIAAFIFLPVGQAFAGPQLNPGKWEITTTTQMAGLPAQSAKHTQCLTADDAVPTSHDPNQSCEISDIKTKGNTITWKVHCTGGGGKINGNGSVTYSGNTMNGTLNMTTGGMQIKSKISGRRIGACDGQTSTATQPRQKTVVEEEIIEDVIDVGRAARDEAKQGVIDEVRGAIRGLFE
jgi:hypothetical protein